MAARRGSQRWPASSPSTTCTSWTPEAADFVKWCQEQSALHHRGDPDKEAEAASVDDDVESKNNSKVESSDGNAAGADTNLGTALPGPRRDTLTTIRVNTCCETSAKHPPAQRWRPRPSPCGGGHRCRSFSRSCYARSGCTPLGRRGGRVSGARRPRVLVLRMRFVSRRDGFHTGRRLSVPVAAVLPRPRAWHDRRVEPPPL